MSDAMKSYGSYVWLCPHGKAGICVVDCDATRGDGLLAETFRDMGQAVSKRGGTIAYMSTEQVRALDFVCDECRNRKSSQSTLFAEAQ